MSDQLKIFNLYEGNINQSAMGADQQRNPNGNLKYRPGDAAPGQSYARYNIPTTGSVKVKGSPFVPNGISDEEMVIKGYGVIDSGQAAKFLERLKKDIHDLINKNVTGAILKSKIDLYSSIIKQMG